MTDAAIAELRALCDILAPAGRESRMTRHMADAFGRHSSDVTVDWQGNVTATFGTGSPSVVLCAHMDEIGFVVRDVTDDGFLRVERVGGVGRRAALGRARFRLRVGIGLRGGVRLGHGFDLGRRHDSGHGAGAGARDRNHNTPRRSRTTRPAASERLGAVMVRR